jgi:hypothetical protein
MVLLLFLQPVFQLVLVAQHTLALADLLAFLAYGLTCLTLKVRALALIPPERGYNQWLTLLSIAPVLLPLALLHELRM